MHLIEGTTLQNGRFTIIKVLGQGGFGITYLARNEMLDNLVAVKEFFPKDFCGRDDTSHLTVGTASQKATVELLKSRFLKEARNLAKLNHQGIVRINDVFEDNNTAYYVMEYVEGESLSQLVKRNGALPVETAIDFILKIGEALEYVHSKNMTHFDVKPANVMVRRDDNMPILIDFGLAKQYDTVGNATSTVMQGVSHGYSAIELYTAGTLETFSPQTDVYSLAATLYNLLTGQTPPVASDLLNDGLKFTNGVTPSLQELISKAMSPNRKTRHQSIRDFCDQLRYIRNNGQAPQDQNDESTHLINSQARGPRLNSSAAEAATRVIDTPLPDNGRVENGKNGVSVKFLIIAAAVIVILTVGVVLLINSNGNDGRKAVAEPTEIYESADETQDAAQAQETQPAVEESGLEGMILRSPSTSVGGKTVHFYRGSFTLNGKSWPIGVAFVEQNGKISSAVYKNIQYNVKLNMSYSSNADGTVINLYGNQGNSPFNITLTGSYGDTLTGEASADHVFDVDLTPSSQTFAL